MTTSNPIIPSSTSTSTSTSTLSTSNNSSIEPKVDFIIEFSIKTTKLNDKLESIKIEKEYSDLIRILNENGLDSVGRKGPSNSNIILILVKCKQLNLIQAMKKERMSDFLHGVGSVPLSIRNLLTEPILQAERLRLVHTILTTTLPPSTLLPNASPALSLVPNCPRFPHVLSIFPPHNPTFNKLWMKSWSSKTHILSIPTSEVTDLTNYYGSGISIYFSFLHFYFLSLIPISMIGFLFWLSGLKYSPIYSFVVLIWSIVFIESWRLKEKELAVEWKVDNIKSVESIRPQFQGTKKLDPVTGEIKPTFPWYNTLLRQLSSIPIVLAFAGALAVMLSCIYAIETLVAEIYVGPGKRFLALIPTILLSGLIPQFTKLWEIVARRLTSYENHKHRSNFTNSLTLKVFSLSFLLAYGALFLTSYVYIPFGGILIPYILSLLPQNTTTLRALQNLPSGTFSINSSKLHTQVIAFTLTGQIIGAFTENVVPILLRSLNQKVVKVQEKRRSSLIPSGTGGGEDLESEKVFLERIRFESTLPEYNQFVDYVEMVLQFGYINMFSLIWPVAPIFSVLNNFFELRSDAFKLATQSRRPIPTRECTIGPWLEVLGFITWCGSITNASLVYLYQPHYISTSSTSNSIIDSLKNSTTVTMLSNLTSLTSNSIPKLDSCSTYTNLHRATLNQPLSNHFNSITSTLFTALLIALTSEHIYLILKSWIRYLLIRMIWIGGKADIEIKKREVELKKGYLKEGEAKLEKREIDQVFEKEEEVDLFWKRGDLGLEEIRRRNKID